MTSHHPPTRKLRDNPDLDQLKRQAKELLAAFRVGAPDAVTEVHSHLRDADPAKFALHDAQLVIARAYGFASWSRLKAQVEGATIKRFTDAVRANDMQRVTAMLDKRAELAHLGNDNYQPLHFAVLNRSAEMVRLLVHRGANPDEGVYPHRDATSPRAIAEARGYDDIVRAITEEEQRRRDTRSGESHAPSLKPLLTAIQRAENDRAIEMLEADPALVHSRDPRLGFTALHIAARNLNVPVVRWLLEHGADTGAQAERGLTPIDAAAHCWWMSLQDDLREIAQLLLAHGAAMTPSMATALGDLDWLRAQHAKTKLENRLEEAGGMLTIAIRYRHPDVVVFLLDCGFDPDERIDLGYGDEPTWSWGFPLYTCAGMANYEMAELLLKRGADPNAMVYASGDCFLQAYGAEDFKMIDLLRRYGGMPNATIIGLFRQTDLARHVLAGEAQCRLDGVGGDNAAEQLLWGGACGGDPEIVRMALAQVTWLRDDPRWFTVLEQPLRIWAHGSVGNKWDRRTYRECFRLVLEHCDPNLRGRPNDNGQFGLTMLHSVAGSREHLTPQERVAFATMLLDAGARLDLRDNLLHSTPLGWAARWGRTELVKLFLDRGADPVEAGAEPWTRPLTWAQKMNHTEIADWLRSRAST